MHEHTNLMIPSLKKWFTVPGAACLALLGGGPPSAHAGETLLGKRAPEWEAANWLNSTPLRLSGLAGKVVLVRWWTAPGCRIAPRRPPR